MSMSVEQDISAAERGEIVRVEDVAVGGEYPLAEVAYIRAVGKYRELKHHLVDLGFAVAAYGYYFVPQTVEHIYHLLGCVLVG